MVLFLLCMMIAAVIIYAYFKRDTVTSRKPKYNDMRVVKLKKGNGEEYYKIETFTAGYPSDYWKPEFTDYRTAVSALRAIEWEKKRLENRSYREVVHTTYDENLALHGEEDT